MAPAPALRGADRQEPGAQDADHEQPAEARHIADRQVEIAGDAELARRLERLATRFEPDIDEVFSRVFGDVVGFQIARGFRRAIGAARKSASALVRDAADYLVEERRDLVAKPEMEQFLDEVDELRERADRFEARFRRLNAVPRA